MAFPRWKEAYPGAPCIGCLTLVLETWSAGRASVAVALVTLFLIHVLGLGGKLVLAAAFEIPMQAQAGRIEGEHSGAARGDAQDAYSTAEPGMGTEDGEFVFGWGTDYTHYFIGFVLLYVCAGCGAGCCGLYARYMAIANSGGSTVVGSPPAASPRQQLAEHETNPGVGGDARP